MWESRSIRPFGIIGLNPVPHRFVLCEGSAWIMLVGDGLDGWCPAKAAQSCAGCRRADDLSGEDVFLGRFTPYPPLLMVMCRQHSRMAFGFDERAVARLDLKLSS